MRDREPINNSKKEIDLTNQDNVRRILESGTIEEQQKLGEFLKVSPEQIDLFSYYAKLRQKTIEEMHLAVEERRKINPVATPEELNMGAYLESIEPQVRQVVVSLRRKGYSTILSGFSGYNGQEVRIDNRSFEHISLDESLIEELEKAGITIETVPNSLRFKCNQPLGIDQLKDFWTKIEKFVPDLGEPAKECDLHSAKVFRKKQQAIK